MMRKTTTLSGLAGAALSLSLAACATAPATPDAGPSAPGATKPPPVTVYTATPGIAAKDRLRKAVDLLGQGQVGQARAELAVLAAEQPGNATARSLLEQIDQDPKVLLGEKNFTYVVKPGETMTVLAQRFLGDPMKFYALARYNGIAAPATMEVGQSLLIPGVPRKAAPAARKPAGPGAAAAPAGARNPGRAAQLRRAGLDSLNRGAVDGAVALFRQALSFDPGNALIQGDLDRALRLQSSVRTR